MRILLGLTLIITALIAWLAAGNVAAQVPVTPTAPPVATATPISEKEQLEIAKLKNPFDHYLLPILPGLLTGGLAILAALLATRPVWRRMKIESDKLTQDRDKYEADRQADAQRREEEQFRFIVEQFSNDPAAKLSAAVVIQDYFREKRLSRFRRQAVEILIGNLRVAQTEPVRKALMVALREGIFSLPPYGERLDLRDCNLKGAEWRPKGKGKDAVGIPLKGAQLQEANLREAQLQGAFLVGAQLQGAQLQGAWLQEAFLVRAQLQGADFLRANLQGAFLVGAQLQGANLGGGVFGSYFIEGEEWKTDFSEAALDDICIASLGGTNWREAIWDDDVRKMLEERYGAPEDKAAAAEPAAETPEEPEA